MSGNRHVHNSIARESRKITALGTLLVALSISGNAGATLIGDTVGCENTFNAVLRCDPSNAVVADGWEFELVRFDPFLGRLAQLEIDVGASSIRYDFVGSGSIANIGPDEIVTIADMDWVGTPGAIEGFSFQTNISNLDATHLSFTEDSFTVDFVGLDLRLDDFLLVDLQASHSAPEPSTLFLLGTGVLGLVACARQKKQH